MNSTLPGPPTIHLRNRNRCLLVATLATAGALVVPSSFPATASAGCQWAGAHPHNVKLGKIRSATLCLLNRKRKSHDVRPLRGNGDLKRAAIGHSADMVQKGYFSHYSRNGDSPTDRIRASGYLRGSTNWATGENIGWGAYARAKPRRVVKAWMQSSGHRRGILNRRYRHVGIGVARGAPEKGIERAATYTTDFGRR